MTTTPSIHQPKKFLNNIQTRRALLRNSITRDTEDGPKDLEKINPNDIQVENKKIKFPELKPSVKDAFSLYSKRGKRRLHEVSKSKDFR
jgi:hypothetical protein